MAVADPRITPLETLKDESYISLTTFRKDGTPRPTPVWFAVDDGTIYVATGVDAYKVKRINHTPRVTIAPCDVQGNVEEGVIPFEGHATVHPAGTPIGDKAKQIINSKYGLQKRLFDFIYWIRRDKYTYIAITPTKS
ncbi:MAG: PPOX class F420-dependent oxidoreductase [Chloroflexota bacterium]